MADLFTSDDVKRLLKNKFIVVLGDSIQRGIYKDLVRIVTTNALLEEVQLRKKQEESHCGDAVYEASQLTNAKTYREVRQFQSEHHLIRFYFLTRCYGEYFQSVLMDLIEGPEPDLIIMNSTLWDVTRYGHDGMESFQKNLQATFHCLTKLLPPHTLILWLTALPVSQEMKGGFLLPEINFLKQTLRLDILLANFFAVQVAQTFGIDVLDMHYFFRHKTEMRVGDGVHWNAVAHRKMTNIILAHVSKAWGVKLPGRDRKQNMFMSPLDAKRATQTVESYMAVPAGPLPWQSDADLNKEKEKKKEEKGITFSASDMLDLDMELAQTTKSKESEKKKEESAISFSANDMLNLDMELGTSKSKGSEKKKEEAFDAGDFLNFDLEMSKPKTEPPKKKGDIGIVFDAGDLLNFDLEMSKPKDEPPAKKKKEDPGISFDMSDILGMDKEVEKKKEPNKSAGISFDPNELLDFDLEMSGKKAPQSNGVANSDDKKEDLLDFL